MKKVAIAAMVAATMLTVLMVAGVGASASDNPHKVYVCKYVGKPGVDEKLQTGGNPIEVDTNALEGKGFVGTFPFEFSDAQGQSIAIGFVGEGFPVLTREDCPAPRTPPPPPPITTTVTTPPPPHTTTPAPVPCPGSVDLGPWYGDPRVNIDLTGKATFVVWGGIQRFTNLRRITKTLACDETFRVNRYKVSRGHFLNISMDGVRIVHVKPPAVR